MHTHMYTLSMVSMCHECRQRNTNGWTCKSPIIKLKRVCIILMTCIYIYIYTQAHTFFSLVKKDAIRLNWVWISNHYHTFSQFALKPLAVHHVEWMKAIKFPCLCFHILWNFFATVRDGAYRTCDSDFEISCYYNM